MSDISFSHQFSQHWRSAPEKIKNAIVQELDDIVKLLDKETELEDFSFQCADLDAYIDDNYAQFIEEENTLSQANHDEDRNNSEYQQHINKADLEETDQSATKTLAAPNALQNDLVKDSQRTVTDDNTSKTEEGGAKEAKVEESVDSQNQATKDTTTEKLVTKNNIKSTAEDRAETQNALNPTDELSNQSTLSKSDLSENHAYVIQELETHIDDYLSEHMTSLSEDLKKWLHDEVKRRIHSL